MGVAGMFRLRAEDGRAILRDVISATGRWQTVAADAGLDGAAIDRMANAFEHDQAERARELMASTGR